MRATGRKDRGLGEENCGGTTQLSSPNAATRVKVFCKSFRRKAGRFAKILRRIFDHRHPHTAGTKSDAPGRTGRGGLGAAEAPKTNTHEQKTVASVVAVRAMPDKPGAGVQGAAQAPCKKPTSTKWSHPQSPCRAMSDKKHLQPVSDRQRWYF